MFMRGNSDDKNLKKRVKIQVSFFSFVIANHSS